MSDNTQLQLWLDKGGRVVFGPNTFMVDVSHPLRIRGGTSLDMSGTVLKVIPNKLDQHEVLVIDDDAGGIEVLHGEIIGDRDQHSGAAGDMGKGFGISLKRRAGMNIKILGTHVSKMWGDGIYISGGSGITISGVVCDVNRRQGMSIVNGASISVNASIFSNTHGTRPEDGIDIEPNKGDVVKNVLIKDNQFIDNNQAHIEIAGKRGTVQNIIIEKNAFIGKGVPLKINGVPEEGKYKPSLWAQFMGAFGNYSGYPRTARIA